MGCCVSKSQGEPYMGTNMSERDPFGILFEVHKGICKVGAGSGSGTGFLCTFDIEDHHREINGLLTTSYTLDVRELANAFTLSVDVFHGGKNTSVDMTIDPKDRFRFSCAILDVTFVELSDSEVAKLKRNGRRFLKLDTTWEGRKGEEVLIVQQQAGMKSRLTNGVFNRYHGFYILHTSKSKIGSWGSPLTLKDGRVIGLHKRRATQKAEDVDVATSSSTIVRAISLHCLESLPVKLISNPIRFNEGSEARILEHGLKKCADRDNRILIFVSAELETEHGEAEKEYANPIWFVPTNHGWYWTPTNPFDRTQEINWMNVDSPEVIGGKDHRKKMSREDWKIAKWLKSTGSIQKMQ